MAIPQIRHNKKTPINAEERQNELRGPFLKGLLNSFLVFSQLKKLAISYGNSRTFVLISPGSLFPPGNATCPLWLGSFSERRVSKSERQRRLLSDVPPINGSSTAARLGDDRSRRSLRASVAASASSLIDDLLAPPRPVEYALRYM